MSHVYRICKMVSKTPAEQWPRFPDGAGGTDTASLKSIALDMIGAPGNARVVAVQCRGFCPKCSGGVHMACVYCKITLSPPQGSQRALTPDETAAILWYQHNATKRRKGKTK